MIDAPIPDDEAPRLAALLELRVLDTPAEERFDRITRTACALFGVPIALISLVDARRQWFKSAAGLEAPETPRGISFCGHAIAGEGALVVENALDDPRFFDNPLVLGPPQVRFYAGMPLRARGGWKLGTLCLIDRQPRRFGDEDILRLRDLAAWAETELNRQLEIAAQTAAMRENFVTLVSHELRTPVTSLTGALALLRGESGLDGQQGMLAGIAQASAQRIERIVDDIVDLARLDAGEFAPEPCLLKLSPVIESSLASCQTRAGEADISLQANVPPDLVVTAVADWLQRVLAILLDNALRFSPPASRIVVSADRRGDNAVRIAVSDGGAGIPAAYQPRMFHDFSPADSGDNRQHGGFGIGLAICQRLAVAMNGRLGYEPGQGGGSMFFLDLPG